MPPKLARLNNVDSSSAKKIVGWRKGVGSGNGGSRSSTRVQHQQQILPVAPQPPCEQNDPANAGGATTVREIRKRLEANVAANDAILVKRRKAAGLNDVAQNVVNFSLYASAAVTKQLLAARCNVDLQLMMALQRCNLLSSRGTLESPR